MLHAKFYIKFHKISKIIILPYGTNILYNQLIPVLDNVPRS